MKSFIKRHGWFLSTLLTVVTLLAVVGVQFNFTPNSVQKFELVVGTVAEASGTVDYICDGTDDNIQLQGALDALPANGGQIRILAGNYDFANLTTVTRALANVTIVGTGRGTYITCDGVTAIFTAGGNNWVFKDLRTDAGGLTMGATTGWIWENVTINATYYTLRTPTDGNIDIGIATIDTLNAPTGRAATYVVAASDAPATVKAQADYVCDGMADDVQIEAALNVDTTTDVYIRLVGSLFTIASELTITGSQYRTITIEGEAPSLDYRYYLGTTLKLADNANCNMFANADDVSFRSLFLRNLSLDGNNANNTSGNGIYANNHLLIGDWGNIGLFCVTIQNFKESGINVPAGETTGLTASGINVGFNGGYGAYIAYGQMVLISGNNWFHDNAKTNFYAGTLADSWVDVYSEGSGEYGVYAQLTHSYMKAWSATSEWQGVYLNTCDTAQIELIVRGACSDLTGCPEAGNPAQVFLNNNCKALSGTITVDEYGAVANIDAMRIHSTQYCNFNVNLYSSRYALYISAPQQCTSNTITGIMRAGTQPTIYWNTGGKPKDSTTFFFNNIQGVLWTGVSQSFSIPITAGGAGTKTAWQNPFAQDCLVQNVTVRLTTGDADAANGDCGVVASATTVGTDIFADLPCETTGVYYSYTAAGGGTQTVPIVLNASGGANDYITFTLADNDGTSVVGYIYITLVGI